MPSLKQCFFLSLASCASMATAIVEFDTPDRLPGCGEVDVYLTGVPPYHPLVTSQGFNPTQIDAAVRKDAADVLAAGYNIKVVCAGPEQPLSVYDKTLRGRNWEATAIGFGIRGSRLPDLTIRFEDIVQIFRDRARRSRIVFNNSPNSTLWAMQRTFPLSSNCTDQPGKDLGFEIFCDPTVCTGQPA